MFEKFRLVQISKNIEGGEAQTITAYETEKECYNAFYTALDKVGTNPSTAKLEMMILGLDGKAVKIEQIDNTRY